MDLPYRLCCNTRCCTRRLILAIGRTLLSWGLNSDHPLFTEIQGIPASPDDFSGGIALKMDSEFSSVCCSSSSLMTEYTPMIDTLATPGLALEL